MTTWLAGSDASVFILCVCVSLFSFLSLILCAAWRTLQELKVGEARDPLEDRHYWRRQGTWTRRKHTLVVSPRLLELSEALRGFHSGSVLDFNLMDLMAIDPC